MHRDVEVIVVGAGVMGLATARALSRRGREVLLLEQFALAHDRGSSHGSSRIFRLSYPEEHWVRLAQESLPHWRELERETGETLLEQTGSIDFGDWSAHRRALEAAGAAVEILERAELERRYPLRVGVGERALLQRDGGFLHAERARRALAESGAAAGLRLLEEARVERIAVEGTAVRLSAGGGELVAGAVVVTAGAWARGLLAPLGIELPVVATRETVSYFTLEHVGPLPSLINAADGSQPGYALAAPGVGLKAGHHMTGAPADPDEPAAPDAELVERTAAWVESRFRGVTPLDRAETCLYTNADDQRFVLERHGRLVVGSPCSGHGFKFAPAIGERLAALAAASLAGE